MKKAPKIKGYKGGGDVYGTQIDVPPAKLTPQQWEAQNLKLGYLRAPGQQGAYGSYYNPKEYYADDKGGFTRLSDRGNPNVNYSNDPTYKPLIEYRAPVDMNVVKPNPKPIPAALTSDRTAFDFQYQPQGYTGYKYNDGTTKYLNAKGEEMPKLNSGGLVKKYANGGQTTQQPDIASILGQFAGQAGGGSAVSSGFSGSGAMGAATSVANTVAGEMDKNAMDEYGRYKSVESATGSNALKYGAQGASLGTMIAPGLGTAIGAGVGALAGGIYGNWKGRKDAGKISDEQQQIDALKKEQEMAAKRPMINGNIASALYSRDNENYAKGGPVKGREPIIVNNPNDPRLIAYNDSLDAYNKNEKYFKLHANIMKTSKTKEEAQKRIDDLQADESFWFDKNTVKPAKVDMKKSPIIADRTSEWGDGFKTTKHPFFVKPVQPYKYEDLPVNVSKNSNLKVVDKPKENTQIETTPYYQIKHTKDNTGKIINTEYYNFDGKKIEVDSKKYASGGKIVGPGTGKSDSISAKVREGSHIIPVENAPIAMEIRKKILKAPTTKKANLNQKGGVDVKLSNGEVEFTPEEKMVVENELGEGVLDALSPDADDKDEYLGQKHQMAKGGSVSGSDSKIDPDKLREANKAERFKLRDNAIKEYRDLKAKAERPGATEVDKFTYRKRLPELERTISSINKEYGIMPKTADLSTPNAKGVSKAPSVRSGVKTANNMPRVTFNPNDYAAADDPNLQAPVSALPQNGMPANNTQPAVTETPLSQSAREAEANYVAPKVDANGFDWNKVGDVASTALNYGIPLAQVYMGNKYLKDAGKRPVDQLDPDYLASIDKANAATALANKNAQFGFNPAEMAALNQQNQNLTNAGVFAARNFSGGSGAGALANTRSALADAYGRDLQTQIQDKNLMYQKQEIANQRQQYANDLITRKAEMQRRLFGDTMTAFNQNQQSGADLLQAGLTNLVGANRYEQEKKAIDKRAQLAGSWMGTV